jgi:hypothetical protein
LYATSTCKQSLAGQLEEQCSLTNVANSAVARLKMEAESAIMWVLAAAMSPM